MHRRLQYLAFLLLFCAPFLLAAKEPNWLKLRSEHFEIYSAENEKKARKVLEHLERVRKAYELLTNAKMPAEERVRVLLFRNEAEYREYALDPFSSAHYLGARDRDYIVLADFEQRTETVLNHEYFHLFSRHAQFRLPVWLEEGLADLYSTLKITRKDVTYGYPLAVHLRYLQSSQGSPLPLAAIFAINRENRHGGDRATISRLYAQGWALAHMTFEGKEMGSRSELFFQKVRDGSTDAATAYKMVYGYDVQQLDELLTAYVRNKSFYYGGMRTEGLDFIAPTELAPIEDWETPLLLADMLALTKKEDLASLQYDELAAQFPDVPEIEESRGYLAWDRGNRAGALPYFRAAAQKKSRNGMLYLHLAELACDYTAANADCTAWINESLRLNPTNKQARDWAVGYMLNTHDFQGAIAYLLGAGRVTAHDAPDFFHKLGYAHYQLRQFKEARAAVTRGLEFAKKPEDLAKLHDMERHIDAAESNGTEGKESNRPPH